MANQTECRCADKVLWLRQHGEVHVRERLGLQEDLQLREELLVQRREMSTPRCTTSCSRRVAPLQRAKGADDLLDVRTLRDDEVERTATRRRTGYREPPPCCPRRGLAASF